jgi:hypothetical protein
MLAATIANVHRGPGTQLFKASDFMPDDGGRREREMVNEQLETLQRMAEYEVIDG